MNFAPKENSGAIKPRAIPTANPIAILMNRFSFANSPFIPDGSLVYVRRGAPLQEFDVGIFFVDGDVFCKQWCVDYAGTLHLLSANPVRQDANIEIPRAAGRSCICFGKVLLDHRLPQPSYY